MDPGLLAKFQDYIKQKGLAADKIWFGIRDQRKELLPEIIKTYHSAKRAELRVRMLFHCIGFARESPEAFQLGLVGLQDKSSLARYRACMIVAYSLKREALPYLRPLLSHDDPRTREDAQAAIKAIEAQNHHLFVDREGSGRTTWRVNDGDV